MSISLLIFIAINFIAALSGAIFSPGQWFDRLEKPSWQPPNWAFPVVWTVLYILNAISGWMVYQAVGLEGPGIFAMVVYIGSLALNALWSAVFFGMKRMDLASYEAILLWASVAFQIVVFYPISAIAALILLPYLAWVTIAVFLSFTVWKLNPEAMNEKGQAQ